MGVAVHMITTILQVHVHVAGFQFDRSLMAQPEFCLATRLVFCTVAHGTTPLQASWQLFRTFQDFQGLDTQLRRALPHEMTVVAPLPRHRRRTWLHCHRHASFLTKRCAELNRYLERVVERPDLRLTRFLDPRAPLMLRYFCNFEAAIGSATVAKVQHSFRNWVLSLEYKKDEGAGRADSLVRPPLAIDDENRRGHAHVVKDVQLDELEANLLDDKLRNVVLCVKYHCACRVAPFSVVYPNFVRMLHFRGWKPVYVPLEGTTYTALYCVLYHLQQWNDLDKRLYDAMTEFGRPEATLHASVATQHLQLSSGVDVMHQTLANYGLLHAHILAHEFNTTTVDVQRRLHDFKARRHVRVGAMELALLATMLNLSIRLVTNDHAGSETEIRPLATLPALRRGNRSSLTLGYTLPTLQSVHGFYLLADRTSGTVPLFSAHERRAMWQGTDEMDRHFLVAIETTLAKGTLWSFDDDVADALNPAILNAVWDDCHHNPNLFALFQRQAREFGKRRTSAHTFLRYLELAFTLEGATYLVDFLLHVLPEDELRTQLHAVRWMRVHRQVATRVLPAGHQ